MGLAHEMAIEQGAYITDGTTLYQVLDIEQPRKYTNYGLAKDVQPAGLSMNCPARRIWLENVQTDLIVVFDEPQVQARMTLVKKAAPVGLEDLVK